MWRLPEHAEEDLARFRERRAEARTSARCSARALSLQPREPRREIYGKTSRRCAPLSSGLRDRGRRGHLPRRLAPRRGLRGRAGALVPALSECSSAAPTRRGSCSRTRPAPAARSGARSTSSRARGRARPPSAARHLPRLLPPLRLRLRRRRPTPSPRRSPSWTTGRPRPASRAARQRRGRAARLEPRPARERPRGRARRAPGRLPRPLRRSRASRRVMETPGPDGHGPDAAEMQKLRDLHGRWHATVAPRAHGCLCRFNTTLSFAFARSSASSATAGRRPGSSPSRDVSNAAARTAVRAARRAARPHELAHRVVAGPPVTELPCGLADRSPRGRDRHVVPIQATTRA